MAIKKKEEEEGQVAFTINLSEIMTMIVINFSN
jgi:hypothetical protein